METHETQEYEAYLAQLPDLTRRIHHWLNVSKGVSLAVMLGIFVRAMYVSIFWKTVNPLEIPFWWMLFAATSGVPSALVMGLDLILLRGRAPLPFGKGPKMITMGARAVIEGALLILGGLVWSALLVGIGYATWTQQFNLMEILINIFANLIAIVVAVAVLGALLRNLLKQIRSP